MPDKEKKEPKLRASSEESHWGQNVYYPVCDWIAEVEAEDTRLGYHAWVEAMQDLSNCTHFCYSQRSSEPVCDVSHPQNITRDPAEVTCPECKQTEDYLNAVTEKD
jgi:hypothetical protein